MGAENVTLQAKQRNYAYITNYFHQLYSALTDNKMNDAYLLYGGGGGIGSRLRRAAITIAQVLQATLVKHQTCTPP